MTRLTRSSSRSITRARRTPASSTASRSAAGTAGSTNARRASSCRRSTKTASLRATRATCWPAPRLAASPGFAGRQTDTGEEIEVEFTPDNQAVVFGATTNRNEAAYAFTDSQLFVVKVSGGEPRQITTGRNNWSQPRFTPDGRTLLAVLETQGPNVYNAVAPCRACPGRRSTSTRSSRTASIDRWAVLRYHRIRACVYFTAEDGGNEKLYSARLGGGAVQTMFGRGQRLVHQPHDSRRAPTRLCCTQTGRAPARPAKSRW